MGTSKSRSRKREKGGAIGVLVEDISRTPHLGYDLKQWRSPIAEHEFHGTMMGATSQWRATAVSAKGDELGAAVSWSYLRALEAVCEKVGADSSEFRIAQRSNGKYVYLRSDYEIVKSE